MFHIFRHKKSDAGESNLAHPSPSAVIAAKEYFESGSALEALQAGNTKQAKLYTMESIEYKAGPFTDIRWRQIPQDAGYGWILGELNWDIKISAEGQQPSDVRPGYDREVWLSILTDRGMLTFGQCRSSMYGKYELLDASASEFKDWVAAERAVKDLLDKG